MSALTADVIVDRIRSICVGPVFGFEESTTWESFEKQPSTNIDGVFRIPPPHSEVVIGGFAFAEDRTDVLQIWVARKHNQDYDGVRRTLLQDVHSLTSAVVRDAHVSSGDYTIPDAGRGHSIEDSESAEYITLRLTLPINYDAQL